MHVRGDATTEPAADRRVDAGVDAGADPGVDPVPALVTLLTLLPLVRRGADQYLLSELVWTSVALPVLVRVVAPRRAAWSWPLTVVVAGAAGALLLRPALGAVAAAAVLEAWQACRPILPAAPDRDERPVVPLLVLTAGAIVAVVHLLTTSRALVPAAELAGAALVSGLVEAYIGRRPSNAADRGVAERTARVAAWWHRSAGRTPRPGRIGSTVPPPRPLVSPRTALLLAPPTAVVAFLAATDRRGAARVVALVALVAVVLGWYAPAWERRAVDTLRAAWTALATVLLLAPIYALVVTPIGWLLRLVRRPPLDLAWGPGRDSYWLVADGPHVDSLDRMFADDRAWHPLPATTRATAHAAADTGGLPPAPRGTRARRPRLVIAAIVVAVAVAATVTLWRREQAPEPQLAGAGAPGAADSAALRDEPWAADAYRDISAATQGAVYTSFTGWSLRDFTSRYVNVSHRVRSSYEPAVPAGTKPLVVWFLGGSTMFGYDLQRDDHTIPSEFARLAEQRDVAVSVRNYGAPGYVGYQSAVLLSLLLTEGERPDLVVLYDGANDTANALLSRFAGSNTIGEPADLQAPDLRSAAARAGIVPGMSADPPSPLAETAADVPPTVAGLSASVVDVYRRSIELTDALSERYGVPVVRFWQPSIHSKQPLDPGERERLDQLVPGDASQRGLARLDAAIRARLDPSVHDLGASLDAVGGPVFSDTVHVNERGAAAIAAAMYADTEPLLAR